MENKFEALSLSIGEVKVELEDELEDMELD